MPDRLQKQQEELAVMRGHAQPVLGLCLPCLLAIQNQQLHSKICFGGILILVSFLSITMMEHLPSGLTCLALQINQLSIHFYLDLF